MATTSGGRPSSGRPSHHVSQAQQHTAGSVENTRRRTRQRAVLRAQLPSHMHSPFPWMNYSEAVVQEALMELGVPFLWHGFQGNAPDFQFLMAGFAPTFTLPDYRTAIFVIAPYLGSIPGVLDKTSLAISLLQVDWWHTVILYDSDIVAGKTLTILQNEVHELSRPHILGPEIPNPYGDVQAIAKRRAGRFAQRRRGRFIKAALVGGTHGTSGRRAHRRSDSDYGERRRFRGATADDRTQSRRARRRLGGGGGG